MPLSRCTVLARPRPLPYPAAPRAARQTVDAHPAEVARQVGNAHAPVRSAVVRCLPAGRSPLPAGAARGLAACSPRRRRVAAPGRPAVHGPPSCAEASLALLQLRNTCILCPEGTSHLFPGETDFTTKMKSQSRLLKRGCSGLASCTTAATLVDLEEWLAQSQCSLQPPSPPPRVCLLIGRTPRTLAPRGLDTGQGEEGRYLTSK